VSDGYAAVALYVGLNALLLLALAYNVGARRGAQKALEPGATGDAALMRAIRAHGNFAEYAPVALLILAALALNNTAALPVHILGAAFTIGRVLHAIGMMRETHPNAVRFFGNLLTGLVLLLGGGLCVLRFYEALTP